MTHSLIINRKGMHTNLFNVSIPEKSFQYDIFYNNIIAYNISSATIQEYMINLIVCTDILLLSIFSECTLMANSLNPLTYYQIGSTGRTLMHCGDGTIFEESPACTCVQWDRVDPGKHRLFVVCSKHPRTSSLKQIALIYTQFPKK